MAIDYEVRDRIAYISFCRPDKLNALRDEDIADLTEALGRFDYDDTALVAILSGQGTAFSAGSDIAARLQTSVDAGSVRDRTNEFVAFYDTENWKPIIAAIHGYCLGHAFLTALLCDLTVVARSSVFQITEITIGLPGYFMWRAMASHPMLAMDLALTGRHFTAEEASHTGIVTRIVDDGQHVREAEELARQIMKNPQWAVREQVRLRRNILAEDNGRMKTAVGNVIRNWAQDAEAAERIAEKLASQR